MYNDKFPDNIERSFMTRAERNRDLYMLRIRVSGDLEWEDKRWRVIQNVYEAKEADFDLTPTMYWLMLNTHETLRPGALPDIGYEAKTIERAIYLNEVQKGNRPNMTTAHAIETKAIGTDIAIGDVMAELRYFADRSIYDAISTLFSRHCVQSKRAVREYTLPSVLSVARDSDYKFAKDISFEKNIEEVGPATMWAILNGHYELIYSGIRSSYIILGRDGNVMGYADLAANGPRGMANLAIYGRTDTVNEVLSMFNEKLTIAVSRVADRLEVNSDGSVVTTSITLPRAPSYAEDLYPNVNVSPRQLMDDWMKSDSRCLIFYGCPGGGKSSFSTQMLDYRGYEKIVVCDDTQLLQNPTLINAVRGLPDGSMVLFEDADILMESRTEGNRQMSALLNVISGIAERDIRFVFLTNLRALNKIDPALLRPGRTYRSIEFKAFKQNQVNHVRDVLKKPALSDEDIATKDEWTLGDIVHYETSEPVEVGGFGFLN